VLESTLETQAKNAPLRYVSYHSLFGSYKDFATWLPSDSSRGLTDSVVFWWLGILIRMYLDEEVITLLQSFIRACANKKHKPGRQVNFLVSFDANQDLDKLTRAYNNGSLSSRGQDGESHAICRAVLRNVNRLVGREIFSSEYWDYRPQWDEKLGAVLLNA